MYIHTEYINIQLFPSLLCWAAANLAAQTRPAAAAALALWPAPAVTAWARISLHNPTQRGGGQGRGNARSGNRGADRGQKGRSEAASAAAGAAGKRAENSLQQ